MTELEKSTKSGLISRIEAAWANLESFISGLSEGQLTDLRDDQGWSIKDHITHLAAWEQALAMLFQGKPRYQSLGIEQTKFTGMYSDENNEAIRERWQHHSIASALAEFRRIHTLLMTSIQGLSDSDLDLPVAKFFPHSSNDPRTVREIVEANTNDHFLEHLAWTETLVASSN